MRNPRPICDASIWLTVLAGLLAYVGFVVVPGCSKPSPGQSAGTPVAATPTPAEATANLAASAADGSAATGPTTSKVKVTAYINVTSGCQEETVALINKLGMDNRAVADTEIVDFGSPEGQRRWENDGLNCMTILFNGSPVVKFPDKHGDTKVVAFLAPAGFNWEHEDLQAAFAALKAGKLQILTEEEARREFEPKPVSVKIQVREAKGMAELQINGVPVLVVKAKAGDKTPAKRAKEAKEALAHWLETPVHPSDLALADRDGGAVILAKGRTVIQVTPQDAKQAGQPDAKRLALEWMRALKAPIAEAMKHSTTG